MRYPYNLDYEIVYKKVSYGLFKLYKQYQFVIVEHKWKYSEYSFITERYKYSLYHDGIKTIDLESKNLLIFNTIEEAKIELEYFKRSSNVRCYKFMEHLIEND